MPFSLTLSAAPLPLTLSGFRFFPLLSASFPILLGRRRRRQAADRQQTHRADTHVCADVDADVCTDADAHVRVAFSLTDQHIGDWLNLTASVRCSRVDMIAKPI